MKYKLMGVAAALCLSTSAASAATYGFTCITSGVPCTTVGTTDQILVNITESGSQVNFLFTNAGGVDTGVANVYFDSSLLSYSSPAISTSPGAVFALGGNPGNLPVGNTLTPPFSSNFTVSAVPPAPVNALDVGEQLIVTLALAPTVSFQDFLASIGGDSRIGLNMTSIGGSLVIEGGTPINPDPDVTAIPVPAALPLMFADLVGMGFIARRRRT